MLPSCRLRRRDRSRRRTYACGKSSPTRDVVLEVNTREVPVDTGHEINPSDEMAVALRVAGQARGLARGVLESRGRAGR